MHLDDTECRKRVLTAEQAFEQQVEQQLAGVQRVVDNRRLRAARCTNLIDLLLRVSQAPGRRVVLIVSNGVETCSRTGWPQIPAPASDSRVAFVLVGSTSQSDSTTPTLGEQFLKRRQALLHAAPWLRGLHMGGQRRFLRVYRNKVSQLRKYVVATAAPCLHDVVSACAYPSFAVPR